MLLISHDSKASQIPAPLLLGPIHFSGLDLGDSLWDVPLGSWSWIYMESTTTLRLRDPFPTPRDTRKGSKKPLRQLGGLSSSLKPSKPLSSGLVLPQGWRICPLPTPPFSLVPKQSLGHRKTKFRFGGWPLPLKPEASLPPHWIPLAPFCQDTNKFPQS